MKRGSQILWLKRVLIFHNYFSILFYLLDTFKNALHVCNSYTLFIPNQKIPAIFSNDKNGIFFSILMTV